MEELGSKSPETRDLFDEVDDYILVNLIYELLLFVDRETAFDMMVENNIKRLLKHETGDRRCER